jgi:hypothetical protein
VSDQSGLLLAGNLSQRLACLAPVTPRQANPRRTYPQIAEIPALK